MKLLFAVKLFFLAQAEIFKRAFPRGKRATMAAMQQPLLMQKFEVLADGDLRCFVLPGRSATRTRPSRFTNSTIARLRSSFITRFCALSWSPEVVISFSLYSVRFRLSSAHAME